MSIPITCLGCGEVTGSHNPIPTAELLSGNQPMNFDTPAENCPGKGMHPAAERTERLRLFGLVKRVRVTYPESGTASSWDEYVGQKNRFLVWLAIMTSSDKGVLVNHKWCWWSLDLGLYGDGARELSLA